MPENQQLPRSSEPATAPAPSASPSSPPPSAQPARKRSFFPRLIGGVARFVLTAAVVLAGVWATAALSLADLDGRSARIWLPFPFALAFLYVVIFIRPHRRARFVAVAMALAVAGWYFSIFPSNDRAWAPGHERLATATITGDHVTLHNYRVLEPGPDGELRQTYVDRTFDLNKLIRADLIMSYWGPKRIAHALVSFEFSDGQHVAQSIEVRRRASQPRVEMVASLFRNYELIYVVGNERALIGQGILDDYHRIFLYRTSMSPQRSRALFLRYADKLNQLADRAQWYNTVTDNCTTGIYMHLRQIPQPPAFSITILLNGYLPEYIYEQGSLDTSMPWPELNRRCDIKEVGRSAYHSTEFSRIVREHVPVPGGGGAPHERR